jgi:hypothetical protein
MRLIIFLLVISVFLISCGQTDTKQKELELKEKELALKEKELQLKETESKGIISSDTSKSNVPSTKIELTSDHSKFSNFWKDFKTAILANDREAVFAMTNMPFKDADEEANKYLKRKSWRSKNKEEFLSNYDFVFSQKTITAIKNDKYRGWDKEAESEPPNFEDIIAKGEYLLMVGFDQKTNRQLDITFTKVKGKYKLDRAQFYS